MKEILFLVLVFLIVLAEPCQGIDTDDVCGGCRILTPSIKKGTASEARSHSRVPSKNFLGLESYAGFITVKEEYDSNMFFWFFPAKNGGSLETTPWIIWLQGGPGYSSMFGLFNLVGPLKIQGGQVQLRDTSLSLNCSVLFLDNPVGAGYSFSKHDDGYPDNEDDVGAQMLEFLVQFLEMFPELRSAPLFIAGESYAGKYIPSLGIQIHRQNVRTAHVGRPVHSRTMRPQRTDGESGDISTTVQLGKRDINLRGLIIGGGMINPGLMMHYSELMSSLGLLDEAETGRLQCIEKAAVRLLREGRMVDAANKFNETIEFIKKRSHVSVYNFIQDPSPNTIAPEFEGYIQTAAVREALGAGNLTFDLNNQKVYKSMLPDIMNSSQPFIEELLNYYPVLCYHGQHDIIMAYSLAMHTYKSLRWTRWQEYHNATRSYLTDSDGNTLAYIRSGGGFSEMLVRHSGHMLPADVPQLATYIHYQFINTYK